MNDTPAGGQPAVQPGQEPAIVQQVLRQVVVILVVIAIWTAALVGYLALTNPSEETPAAAPAEPEVAEVSFSGQVLPLFEARCQQCHGAGRAEGGLKLSSHAAVMAGSNYGPVVIPGSADTSRLVELVVSGSMPLGSAKLPDEKLQTIIDWVDAGAPDN